MPGRQATGAVGEAAARAFLEGRGGAGGGPPAPARPGGGGAGAGGRGSPPPPGPRGAPLPLRCGGGGPHGGAGAHHLDPRRVPRRGRAPLVRTTRRGAVVTPLDGLPLFRGLTPAP